MKRKVSLPAAARTLLAAVLSIGMQTFLQPCIHEDGNFGSCHWAGQAITGVGVVLIVLSIAGMFAKNGNTRKGLAFASAVTAVFACLIPGILIPLCLMNTMRCNLIMRPGTIVLSLLIAVIAAAETFVLQKRK